MSVGCSRFDRFASSSFKLRVNLTQIGGSRRTGPVSQRHDLLVIGEVNLDLIVSGAVVPAFGQQEQLVERADLVLGGSGAITACGAARLGLSVAFCGLAGGDLAGKIAVDQIAAAGIDISAIAVISGERSGIGVGLVREDGDRAILTYPGLIPRLAASDIPDESIERARHVHIGAYFLQTGLHAGLGDRLEEHRRRGGTVSLDPNWDPSGRWDLGGLLGAVDLLLPNDREACLLARCDDVEEAALRLTAQGCAVAVKVGAAGALWCADGHLLHVPVEGIGAIVEATGAGDSFNAGVIAGLLDGLPQAEFLRLGNACGALSLRGVGGTATQPTREEVFQFRQELARAEGHVDSVRRTA